MSNEDKGAGAGPRVVLTINRFDSRCGSCRKSCDPYEEVHERPCGYDQHPGCGARYTHLSSDYADLGPRCREMRPDLIWCGFDDLQRNSVSPVADSVGGVS